MSSGLQRMHSYPAGSEVQSISGHVRKKTSDGTWMGRGRWVAQHKLKKRELEPNERVFHMDGNPANDDPSNLAVITFSGTVYRLKRSKPVYIPPLPPKAKAYIPRYKTEDSERMTSGV